MTKSHKKEQRYISLTIANPLYKKDRRDIKEESFDQFKMLHDEKIPPFSRPGLHEHCQLICPGQPWEQEKNILDTTTGIEYKSTYGANSADWGLREFKKEYGNDSIIFENGFYKRGK